MRIEMRNATRSRQCWVSRNHYRVTVSYADTWKHLGKHNHADTDQHDWHTALLISVYKHLTVCRQNKYILLTQGRTNPGRQVAGANKVLRWCLVGIFWFSVWNLLHVTLQGPRILRWRQDFWKNLWIPHFAHCQLHCGASDNSKSLLWRKKRLLTAGEDYCRNVEVAGISGTRWVGNIGFGHKIL